MSNFVPFIPDNAPFSEEQRAWLNGFLAGIFSQQQVAQIAGEEKKSLRVAVLYASQSGTAESLAKKLAKELKAQGHTPALATLAGYSPAALAQEEHALILASTYGDGDAPDAVQPFYEQLCVEHFPLLKNLSYSVFALGDSHYEHFCRFGKDLDAKLKALGGNCIEPRFDCDVETAEHFAQWTNAVLQRLGDPAHRLAPLPKTSTVIESSALKPDTTGGGSKSTVSSTGYTRDNPLLAPVVEKRVLTRNNSSKTTLHMAFSIDQSGLSYEAGDACGVLPRNDDNLVAEILHQMRCNGNEQVECEKVGATTLHDALTRQLQITRLTKKFVSDYATRCNNASLQELLQPERREQLDLYLHGRGLIDLLVEHPCSQNEPAQIVSILPRLTPRLYSISSSPAAHAGQVHATVAVVRFQAHNRQRNGVCSTFFADRTTQDDQMQIFIQSNKKFRLPKDPDAAMIMIGPGTGIAPFRGFLHERRALGHKGKNWLFFGERSASSDFLYREELEVMLADKTLTSLDTAFSRDQERKIYVQDRMMEQAPRLWKWLEEGSSVYVCGDARQMARDVDAALRNIIASQGNMSPETAAEYTENLKANGRYQRDVY